MKLGVGVHHAGLSFDDRRIIEDLFTQRKLNVVVATSAGLLIFGIYPRLNNLLLDFGYWGQLP